MSQLQSFLPAVVPVATAAWNALNSYQKGAQPAQPIGTKGTGRNHGAFRPSATAGQPMANTTNLGGPPNVPMRGSANMPLNGSAFGPTASTVNLQTKRPAKKLAKRPMNAPAHNSAQVRAVHADLSAYDPTDDLVDDPADDLTDNSADEPTDDPANMLASIPVYDPADIPAKNCHSPGCYQSAVVDPARDTKSDYCSKHGK